MMKVVLKVELHDDKIRKKAMQTASGISGVESVAVDKKDNKMTVIGDVDSIKVAVKLKKLCHANLVSVGPAKEPKKEEKPPEPKKEPEPKKDPKEECAQLFKMYEPVGSQVGIHQSPTSSNMKKRAAEKYYKSTELVLELSPQLNKSLGCMRGLDSCVSFESLQFLLEKLHYEGFAVLVHKNLYEGLQFLPEKLHLSDNILLVEWLWM